MPEVTGVLARIAFFDPLLPDELARIAAAGTVTRLAAGTTVFRQGDQADCLYVVIRGEVRVSLDEDGVELTVAHVGTGEFFGEMALIDGGNRSATVSTVVDSELFVLERTAFLAIFTRSPPLLGRLLEGLSRKLRKTTEMLFREEIDSRLAAVETEMARQRSITHMVTGIAHELNTPLGVCTTAASMVAEWLASPAATGQVSAGPFGPHLADLGEAAALLTGNLRRAVSLVDTFSAISASRTSGAPQTLDLPELITETAELFRQQRGRADITPHYRFAEPTAAWQGHRLQMTQVLMHLFNNVADHAYPSGGGILEIAVTSASLGTRPAYAVTVSDRGAGISPELLPRAFDAFVTAARGRGHKGLGLAIVYNIVTGPLQGTVQLARDPGGGLTATVTTPRRLGTACPA
ncbi:MAG: cyclic nucleotide-binding domain-containing protein [Azospirillum sp.]|nr:cyclic nucleotide-binding domain-containing protein [Azospirillum sp.]